METDGGRAEAKRGGKMEEEGVREGRGRKRRGKEGQKREKIYHICVLGDAGSNFNVDK